MQAFGQKVRPEQLVDGNQRSGRVGRTATHSARHRHVLVDAKRHLDGFWHPCLGFYLHGHLDHQVALIDGYGQQLKLAERTGDFDAVFGGNLRGYSFSKVDGQIEACHIVIAVVAERANLEKQIHLAGRIGDGDLGGHKSGVKHFEKFKPEDFVIETGSVLTFVRGVARAGFVFNRDAIHLPG